MKKFTYIFLLCLACLFCGCGSEIIQPDASEWSFSVKISEIKGLGAGEGISTKISYSGDYGEHSEFELGDFFGLFVLDASGNILVKNLKVYCSGFNNDGKTVWSIFKKGSSDDNTSNYPIADILSQGVNYFAYYPYDESFSKTIADVSSIKSIVSDAYAALPSDQSASYTNLDLLVASNLEGCECGEVKVADKQVSLTFGHVMAMLRYFIPSGSVKYEYTFSGKDFTPYLMGTADGKDEFRFLFKPDCVLDVCVKFVKDKKLYKFETGNSKNIFPITTEAGHCYFLDEHAPKIAYSAAVDMGTSVMWCKFNLGAEDNPDATVDNISNIVGTIVMWGANIGTGNYGSTAYTKYNDALPEGQRPSELPAGYDFSGNPLYDAASNLWRGKWRTPTCAEWEELFNACSYDVEKDADGKPTAIKFTSKTNGNTIRLKYAGYYDTNTATSTTNGYYWSSSSHSTLVNNLKKGYSTLFNAGGRTINKSANLYTGLPLRPVYTK